MLIYANTYNHGYVLDDDDAIVNNRFVQKGVAGLADIWTTEYRTGFSNESGSLYRPVSLSLFAIQTELWPGNSNAAHVFNIILYGLCCMLLFLWLQLLFKSYDVWLPLIASLIFTVLPIHTEVVANIKSVDEILSASFALVSLYSILKADNDGIQFTLEWSERKR